MKKILIFLFLFLLLSGSSYAKQTEIQEREQNKAAYLNLEWWENYKDDILIEHLKNLYANNYDLKNAELKINETQKLVKLEFANELPQVSFDGSISRDFRSSVLKYGSMSIPSFAQNNFQLPLSASYEIDIWGKNRLKTKREEQKLEMVKQLERATYISLTSAFASDYFNLIKTDEFLKIQDEIIKTQQDILSKIKYKHENGLCSVNEVLAEEKYLSLLKEEKSNLENKKEILINALKAYLSENNADIKRPDFSDVYIISNMPEKLSSKVIENRPDYLQSEAGIKMAGFDVRIARKEFLPSFVIFGQIGLNAYSFSDLFKTSTQLANAGIAPIFDIFSGGRKVAFLKLKKYKYDEAVNNYQKTTLEGVKEVNSALSELNSAKKNMKEANNRLLLEDKTFSLLKDKKEIGSASALEVLYGYEAELAAKKENVSNSINYLISTISLYKATGGENLLKIENQNL